jgi:cysteine dioxygenase
LKRAELSGLFGLLQTWESIARPLSDDVIRAGFAHLCLDRAAVRAGVRFSERTYQRNRVYLAPYYEALVLCWRSGQLTPIHDHGQSVCGVFVVEGVATEMTFVAGSGLRVIGSRTQRHPAGSFILSRGSDIHRIANLEDAGTDLITLHIYSPPLTDFRYYRIDDRQLVHQMHSSVPVVDAAEGFKSQTRRDA